MDQRLHTLKHSHARLAAWLLEAIRAAGGALTISETAIAEQSGVSRRTINRAMPQLVRMQIIVRHGESGRSKTYYAIDYHDAGKIAKAETHA